MGEYTAPGQPLMDIAVLAMCCQLTPEQERNFLTSYLGSDASEVQLYSFQALKVLAALRETLWATTAELSKSSALSDEEAEKYLLLNYGKFKDMYAEFEKTAQPTGGYA